MTGLQIVPWLALIVSGASLLYARRANNRSDAFSTVPVLFIADFQMLRLKNIGESNVLDVRVDYDGRRIYVPVLEPGGHVDVCSAFNFIYDKDRKDTVLQPITCEYPAGVVWQVTLKRDGPGKDEPRTIRTRGNSSR